MQQIDATVLFQPPSESQRFLPEGPYRCPDGRLSWVAIQHGPDARTGSLNLLDLASMTNSQYLLPGRAGFAFPTNDPHEFLIGMERALVLFNTATETSRVIVEGVDQNVTNTIINDAVVFDGHVVFGCKDLAFAEPKAGLYLLRAGERHAVQLSAQQVCSNGKAIVAHEQGRYTLYDIDSPSKQVLAWELDLEQGRITRPRVVLDLTRDPAFPDGMILTPDQRHMIIAFYDPRDTQQGEAHCYDIQSGQRQIVWRCDKSPRVTCPQLVQRQGKTKLVLTTADEGMSPELRARCPNAGCLFVADTEFEGLNDNPVYVLHQ